MSQTTRKITWIVLALLSGTVIYWNMQIQMEKEQLTEIYQAKAAEAEMCTKYLKRFEATTIATILANSRFHLVDVDNLDTVSKIAFLSSLKRLNDAIFAFSNNDPGSREYLYQKAQLIEWQEDLIKLPPGTDLEVVQSAYYMLYQATILEEVTRLTKNLDRTKILINMLKGLE